MSGRRFTPREEEIAGLVANGWSQKRIARTIGISIRTVEAHIRNAAAKLDIDLPPMRALTVHHYREDPE